MIDGEFGHNYHPLAEDFFKYLIMRVFKVKCGAYAGEHIIYDSVKEAQNDGYNPKEWSTCEIGDWAIADDGYVLRLLSKRYIKNRKGQITWLFRFCNATAVVYINSKGVAKPYNYYGAISKSKRNTMSNGGVYLTPKLKLWYTLIKEGASPEEAYVQVYKSKPNVRRINLMFENKGIRKMIAKEMVPIIGSINGKLVNRTGSSLDEWFANELVDLITTKKLSPKERLANIKFLKDVFANVLGFQSQTKQKEVEDASYEVLRPSLGTSTTNGDSNGNNNEYIHNTISYSTTLAPRQRNFSIIKTFLSATILRRTTQVSK